ncbi:DUF4157 domain-containing protein [Pseudanabaena sp. FACHB-1998]|uniref:eCIS core domain-containing protein n=1 Tax=Pseudanabaena sp. FACHB-1998 TaxID=2692858 RepID=UPI0016803606|nr:DUF4157 domain-containing protein [Pseudanabaena sp. FACHB-1998]MBD2177771.1 DUF4157 domain-containing protein [Pseudanabaena sp. FACHB-1998]
MNSIRRIGFLILLTLALVATVSISDSNFLGNSEAKSSLVEEAWGQAGSIAYQAASKTMRSKNPEGVPLNNVQKRYLRRYFIDYIDRVTVIYNAQMMDRWVLGNIAVHFGKVESIAQTYCDRVYLRDQYKPDDVKQLAVLAHEMVHVRQCEQNGGLDQFGYQYFVEYKRSSQKYENNVMEREAYDLQNRFITNSLS